MSEKIYRRLLSLYPKRFRREYGAAAADLFHDRLQAERGFLARLRLWLDVLADLAISLPREYRRKPATLQAASNDGIPIFYTADPFAPSRAALAEGAILSIAAFAVVSILLSHWGSHPALLIGSHHPSPSHLLPAQTKAAPADLASEVKLPPYSYEAPVSPYFKAILVLGALDLDHDNVISAAEIATAANSLKVLDINRDGKLSAEECGANFSSLSPEMAKRARTAFMRIYPVLAALDANHDDEISPEEIRYASAALRTLDTNGDGRLTEDELLPDPAVVRARQIMVLLDRNGDGKISMEERSVAPARIRLLLDRAGADGDITEKQLAAAIRYAAGSQP